MSPTYAQNKKFTDNWIKNNRERYRELVRNRVTKYNAWKKIQKVYLNILLDN